MLTIAWDSQELINQYNHLSSGHFFDRDTMRFFNSLITSNYRRINDYTALFITTEKGPSGIRKATIRSATLVTYERESDSRQCQKIVIDTVFDFNSLTLAQAKLRMAKLEAYVTYTV